MLRHRTVVDFWSPELSTFAPGLVFDRSGPHLTRVVASSPGHLLATHLLDGDDVADQRESLIDRLLAPDMLAGAGIRTKSTTAPRFSPGAYHNGSVWPMDTGIIADGLRRHGRVAEANDLEHRILSACLAVGSPVEFFCGERDGSIAINTRTLTALRDGELRVVEQPPQAVQGWTATRLWRILRRRGLIAQGQAQLARRIA
jgi:glycogen debranching enzyme